MELPRKQTRQLKLGSVRIGGGAPIVVQSMTNTDTRDVEATLGQIKRLHDAGCEIVRVAVPDETAARALRAIHDASPIPVIADIHFDYRLALMALEAGLEGLRINPGNIGERKNVEMVVDAAKARGAVIRVGVNSGSVEKRLLEQYGGPTPQAMVESALGHVRILEEHGFYDTKISIKSSSVLNTIECYRLLSQRCDYPLHLGVTEAGGVLRGAIKSSVGMGVLLSEGIGDTLRVSLTAAPEEEMTVAWELLHALGLRQRGPEIISCPTCGRTEIDLIGLAQEVERRLRTENAPIKVAVMGCVVNGPGEAREADLGMAGGRDKGIIFRKGEVIRSVRGQEALLAAFMEELDKLLVERRDL
ncbi:flavodoxin-dependent (E)-4-hydroxy-3-methylbut-2-enyl-diphosphate synthase [Bilophila wadsworthia]|uniref:flavodoxin-dependent (E)-4-hydroxy-3-methylbut-2-enyl-diphosphate synthase n=1 Tax=Bilophila wadsworthia TaxID=35833 RepID=UPI001D0BAF94|nr:flavodoxin-dependent (E)-4-hydroxy-3-methylbut-2-enyl-diphosphate synthase [Bilophila wadsworthia]MCB8569684.1 flavodoxin-dependent (E)-4-hydroxy-3-methylbut-2-enyl-diphosphate synthase [Bilophila wadsworthia]MCC2713567.1 flavodoxin-dependent (E)-4-hydroxy-3-methylbut-2-enyl-diphosphate synthase [Bilophila wadsworthia]